MRAQPGQHQQDAVGHGQRAAGQAGARAAGDERHAGRGAEPHRVHDVLPALGQHHDRRRDPEVGQPVALVRAQLRPIGEHPLGSDGGDQGDSEFPEARAGPSGRRRGHVSPAVRTRGG